MVKLPVIVGYGGINAAGRSSFSHAHNRMVFEALNHSKQQRTLSSLAALMQVDASDKDFILHNTLVRQIDASLFDTENIAWNKRFPLETLDNEVMTFITKANALPDILPDNWQVSVLNDKQVKVSLTGSSNFLLPTTLQAKVRSAGQLPTGFNPGKLYQSRNHPRGIQMTVYGASDAINSMGIDWDTIRNSVAPDQISVYAGSGMSQLDANGNGGMMSARLNGKKVTSKHCPLGFAEMPADFINAYLLGSIGTTGTSMGACASFLYNLRSAVHDIQAGRSRVAIVGNAEAPVIPEIMEGYSAMGALATDDELRELDGMSASEAVNHRRACRPFSTNKGFTLAEASQFIVLFDDDLAMELGANIHGAVSDVFINADGFKKSISAPGVGNYVTVAKAMAAARSIIGEKAFQQRSFFQAHGTGTPQNRVTESHIINDAAKTFGMDRWLVGAVKSYLGHSIGCAAGDQITASLGVWNSGIFPGITTIDHIADDVHASHLNISAEHTEVGQQGLDVGIVNAKGFGGNNATATLLAPHVVKKMLAKKHGTKVTAAYQNNNETIQAQANDYDDAACNGDSRTIYQFDHNVCQDEAVTMTDKSLHIDTFKPEISLDIVSPYATWVSDD